MRLSVPGFDLNQPFVVGREQRFHFLPFRPIFPCEPPKSYFQIHGFDVAPTRNHGTGIGVIGSARDQQSRAPGESLASGLQRTPIEPVSN